MMADTKDRRTTRTKKSLRTALFQLLEKKDISRITVTDLADKADVGRGTFYLHYTDAFDMLDKLENELMEELSYLTVPTQEGWSLDTLLTHMETIWKHIYDHADSFELLANNRNGVRFMGKFKIYCEKLILKPIIKNKHSLEEEYTASYIISGVLGLFQKWMENGMPITPEKLAQIARGILKPGE
jgi:AcrR family transcriptional regulator